MAGIGSKSVLVTIVTAGVTFGLATNRASQVYTAKVKDAKDDSNTDINKCKRDNPEGWKKAEEDRIKNKDQREREYNEWRKELDKNPLLRRRGGDVFSIFGL